MNNDLHRALVAQNIKAITQLTCGFSKEDKIQTLDFAISRAKLKPIKYFMDQGIIINNNNFCYHTMVTKPAATEILPYLDSKGVDLTMGSHILLFKAALSNQSQAVKYLSSKIKEMDDRVVKLCLTNLIGMLCRLRDKKDYLRLNEETFMVLLPKITPAVFEQIVSNVQGKNNADIQQFLQDLNTLYVKTSLENNDALLTEAKNAINAGVFKV